MSEHEHRFSTFGEFRLDTVDRVLYRGDEIVSLAPKALDLLAYLVEHAERLLTKEELLGAVWPDAFVEENNLNQAVSAIRKALGQESPNRVFIETIPRRGYRFVATLNRAAIPIPEGTRETARSHLEPVGGAVPLESQLYIERPSDAEFHAAIARRDSIVLVKGARQIGKTSLLARGLQRARESGARVALTDFQYLGSSDLESAESLLKAIARSLAEQLDLEISVRSFWDDEDSPNTNFGRFVRRHVLDARVPFVWGLDEVDRLFGYPYASEVFGLFRSWHNRRALDPSGHWRNLTLAMAYATESHLFITDPHQSPFNVGTRFALRDFALDEVRELDRRHGSPIGSEEDLERFHDLLGGQPYLTRLGLLTLTKGEEFQSFIERAPRADGPFAAHLHHVLTLVNRDATFRDAVRGLLDGTGSIAEEVFYRLRAAGIVVGEAKSEARLRCRLYETYFAHHLASS